MKLREPFNGLSHLAAAMVALPGAIALATSGGDTPIRLAALLVYGLSLVGMFLASGLYHSLGGSPRRMAMLRKADHAAIYLLIAGTYTPFCALAFQGFWQWGLLAIIWTLAIIGIGLKLFILDTPRWLTAGVYLGMGWLGLAAVGEFLKRLPPEVLVWVGLGGLFYTLGAVVYITKKGDFFPGKFGFHEVWHIFVILGAAAHFVAVASMLGIR